MNNGLVKNLPETILEPIRERIKDTESIIAQVEDKYTLVYLNVLLGLKNDYEQVSDFDNADKTAKEALDILVKGNLNLKDDVLSKNMLSCYDTRARCGDFESFLIAMEWKRPIEKQFYIPRRRILKKFGLIQALQDVADGKLDFLCINMPPRTAKSTSGLFFTCT